MSRRIEWGFPASLLLISGLALVARPVVLRRVAPGTSKFLTESRTPLFDLYVRDDSATVAARSEYRYQLDRRARAERIYGWSVVTLGSVAILAWASLVRRVVLKRKGRIT